MRAKHLLGLCLCAAIGCNAILDNEKRSLATPMGGATDPVIDGGPASVPPVQPVTPPDAAIDATGAIDPARPSVTDSGPPPPVNCPSANEAAECTPGALDVERQACGSCMHGTSLRMRTCLETCTWGEFGPWSSCQEDADACTPGQEEEMVGKCGPCGTDRLVSKRKCTTNCGWSDWSPEVCEMSPDHCAPGATRNLEDVACGQRCGIAKRTQTCNAMCTWDAVVMSACTKQGVCTPGDQMAAMPAGCNAEYCNKGVQPQVSVCTPSCTWGTPQASGKCEYPDDVCRPADLMGTGYRCILNDPGYRQVCYPSTASPALRCTWGPREQFPGCAR